MIRDNLPPIACESSLIRLLKSNGLGLAQFACSKESTLGCEEKEENGDETAAWEEVEPRVEKPLVQQFDYMSFDLQI